MYQKEETWHTKRLSEEDAILYHEVLLRKKRIIPYLFDDQLLGYIESWRIDFEQFGRLICHLPFSAVSEEVEKGPICYVANIWVRKDHRDGAVLKALRNELFIQNVTAEFFVGEALRKKTQPIKVLRKAQIGSLNGQK